MYNFRRLCRGILFGLFIPAGFLLLFFVLAKWPTFGTALAEGPTETGPNRLDRVFLSLPMPNPEVFQEIEGEASKGVILTRLAATMARPLEANLTKLQQEGKISGFRLRPELFAIEVYGPTPDALERLPLGVTVVSGPQALSCARQNAEVVWNQWQAWQLQPSLERLRQVPLETQATNPSIRIYMSSAGYSTSVSGKTDPNTSVRLRIYRRGNQIYEQSTTSNSNGWYYFYPSYTGSSCEGTSGYEWRLWPGDVVEVTAGNRSAQTVVAPLQAWVNPQTNQVQGHTDPGRKVEAVLYTPAPDLCNSTPVTRTASADGAGNFVISFPDFDGQATAYIYAQDENGNSTFTDAKAFHLEAGLRDYWFSGYLPPNTAFTATLQRGSTVVTQTVGQTDGDGSFWQDWWPEEFQPGDVISVTGGGVTLRMEIVNLSLSFDPASNRVSGTTAPNRKVQVRFDKETFYPVSTTCTSSSDCRGTTSDGTGNFSVTSSLDWTRGDEIGVYIADSEGNLQVNWRYAPIIIFEFPRHSSTPHLEGYWGNPSATTITVTLKAPDNTVKDQSTETPTRWGYFSAYLWSISPGDRVEVTDGQTTEQATVPYLIARLDSGADQLRGQTDYTRVVARLKDYRRESLYEEDDGDSWIDYSSYCAEGSVSGGSFAVSFPGADIGGMDGANVWVFDNNGHVATLYPFFSGSPLPDHDLAPVNAFTVWARQDGQRLWGVISRAPVTSSIPVTITVKRGASVLTSTVAYANPTFEVNLGVGMRAGDIIQVRAGNGDATDLTIPALTVNRDTARNEISGQAPASEYVQVFARRGDEYKAKSVQVGTNGSYRTSFTGFYWSDCAPVRLDHPCVQGRVDFINNEGHTVSVWEPDPPPVNPDVYEPDDTPAQARSYTGIQDHTFHTITDTDWISFTVSTTDVNVPHIISVFDTGLGVSGDIKLYRNPNGTEIDSWWFYGDEEPIRWTPSVAGTYYLRIKTWSGGKCESRYRLLVFPVRSQISLPLIMRNAPGW